MSYVLIAAVVIVVAAAIWYAYTAPRRRRARVKKLITESVGTFDEPARAALAELNATEDKTPEDHFDRVRILRHNVLEGEDDIDRAHQAWLYREIAAGYTAAFDGAHPDNVGFMMDDYMGFGAADMTVVTPTTRAAASKTRKEIAATMPDAGRDDIAVAALTNAIKHTNDAQNVHDSSVNNELRAVLARMAPGNARLALSEARQHAANNPRALQALKMVANATYISPFDTDELDIFARVWNRTKEPGNNTKQATEAVITALADCVENGKLVCVNGRCARLLSSLVTIDHDPVIAAGAMTTEAHRNEIYSQVSRAVDKRVAEASREEAQKYTSGADMDADSPLMSAIRSDIATIVSNSGLTGENAERVKAECMEYI